MARRQSQMYRRPQRKSVRSSRRSSDSAGGCLAVIILFAAFGAFIQFLESPSGLVFIKSGLVFVTIVIGALIAFYVLRKLEQKNQRRTLLMQQQQQTAWQQYHQQEAAKQHYARQEWERQERERLERERVARMKSLGDILVLTPRVFEKLTGRILEYNGVLNLQHTGGSGDLGADLIGVDSYGNQIVVQCKRYAPGNAIGSPEIQKFIGMINVHHKAQMGIFVTTTTYTQPAIDLAAQHNIWLINGDTLIQLLQKIH